MINSRRLPAIILLLLSFVCLPDFVAGQFCTRLANNTWSGFVEALEESYRLAVLCPFEISGDGCPSQQDYPKGFEVGSEGETSGLIIVCDPFLYGYNTGSRCLINCPGRHFTVNEFSSLTLDSMVLEGATKSAVNVQPFGKLEVVNSQFNNNVAPQTGGAIDALRDSLLEIEYSAFDGNQAIIGGAVYNRGDAEISQSNFVNNRARAAGGAFAGETGSDAVFQFSGFRSNEAASGGAIHNPSDSKMNVGSSTFDSNLALNGGAFYNGGISNVYDSTFLENLAEEGVRI